MASDIGDTQMYIDKYLQTIQIPPHNSKQLFAIGMVGLNGVGKSTFANALGKELGLYVASNDRIRRWLNIQGFAGASPRQELVQAIAEASSTYLYENQISHVIDNDLVKFYLKAKQNAEQYGARFFLFRLDAPESVILERLKAREDNAGNREAGDLSQAGEEEYYKRKNLHAELGVPSEVELTINTADGIIKEVEKTKKFLIQQNVVTP